MSGPRLAGALVVAAIFTGALVGCPTPVGETGVLTGSVTIGPISPVEVEGENPTVPPEVYDARKIMVYTGTGSRLLKQVDIDLNGVYRVDLQPGDYTVDINRIGIDSSADVPYRVTIAAGETVQLDIDIDTGIR